MKSYLLEAYNEQISYLFVLLSEIGFKRDYMKLLLVIAGKWICELGTLFLLGRFCGFSHLGQLNKLTWYQDSCRWSSFSCFSAPVQYCIVKGRIIYFKWCLMK